MRKDTIETFLEQYQLFQEDQQCKEYKDRFNSNILEPKYSTKHPIERHAGKIYNREIYEKFLHQIHLADAYMVKELIKDEKYIVKRIIDYDEQEYYNNSFPIEVDLKANRFDCICCKYDRDGILCCHVLRLFTQIGIYKIPENYIKQRWTKKWKEDALESMKKDKLQQQSNQTNVGTDAALTYAMMMTKSADLCANLCKDTEKSKYFMEMLERFESEMGSAKSTEQISHSACSISNLKDPPIIPNTSVAKGNRLLRGSEKKRKELEQPKVRQEDASEAKKATKKQSSEPKKTTKKQPKKTTEESTKKTTIKTTKKTTEEISGTEQ